MKKSAFNSTFRVEPGRNGSFIVIPDDPDSMRGSREECWAFSNIDDLLEWFSQQELMFERPGKVTSVALNFEVSLPAGTDPDAPAGYTPLPTGVRCGCPKLSSTRSGRLYCCNGAHRPQS